MTEIGLKGAVFCSNVFKSDKSIDFRSLDNYLIKCLENDAVEAIFSMAYNTRYRQLNSENYSRLIKSVVN